MTTRRRRYRRSVAPVVRTGIAVSSPERKRYVFPRVRRPKWKSVRPTSTTCRTNASVLAIRGRRTLLYDRKSSRFRLADAAVATSTAYTRWYRPQHPRRAKRGSNRHVDGCTGTRVSYRVISRCTTLYTIVSDGRESINDISAREELFSTSIVL